MARLTSSAGDVECPPLDTYVLRFTDASDIFLDAKFEDRDKPENEQQKVEKIDLTFKIAEYAYDADDDDDRDWTGFEIRQRFTIGRNFNHPLSHIGAMIRALEQIDRVPDDYDRDLEELYGRRIKATVGPKESGWPKISSPLAYKKKAPKPKVVEPEYDEDDDGAELFGESAA